MNRRYYLSMVIILLAATFLRVTLLPELPRGLHYDEAANAILTQEIVEGDYRPLFIRAYTGKEVLFFYATAPWMWISGGQPWGLRLGAAMIGVLTVAATFAATRALLGPYPWSRWTALLAAAWMATAFPHVLLSRYGFRAISQPLLQALTVATLWRGLRSGRLRWLLAAGAFLGLTGYTYLAARLFPIPVGITLLWILVRTPAEARWQRAKQIGAVLLTALAVFAPLGLYFVRQPEAFTTRIDQVAASSWKDALHGVELCLKAIVLPGDGDPYVRFNVPGRPLLTPVSVLLAAFGLWRLLDLNHRWSVRPSARLFIISVLLTMVLPSALATSEITPSNLRMVGLYPFLLLLPALGVAQLLCHLPRHELLGLVTSLIILVGGLTTYQSYSSWATSTALFYTSDGEMVLAAEALDDAEFDGATVYVASEHYRHPTVAALTPRYADAKWLTGGATLILPPEGDALYLVPITLAPPAPWPDEIAGAWTTSYRADPLGEPALSVHHLPAEEIAALRPTAPAADFAHVVAVHGVEQLRTCRVAENCSYLVTWEVLAPYATLQPVVRLIHPRTGEWARTLAFHYPTDEWTPGDVVLDQLVLTPPFGTPPGSSYEVGVGFFNPESGDSLPRLVDERFAGLEVRFPHQGGFTLAPPLGSPAPPDVATVCTGIPRREIEAPRGLRLLGWNPLAEQVRAGDLLHLNLCWQAPESRLPDGEVRITLEGPESHILYAGLPAGEYAFTLWDPGTVIEDRYALRTPRQAATGYYDLKLEVLGEKIATLGELKIEVPARSFATPALDYPVEADFDGQIRLLGYDVTEQADETLALTLYWQSLETVEEDYTVFVHLVNPQSGAVVAQADAGPQDGTYPTSLWIPGEVVSDRHILLLPADLLSGEYVGRVGLYLPERGKYLKAAGEPEVTLQKINVGP